MPSSPPPALVAELRDVLEQCLKDTPADVADQITRGLCDHYSRPMVHELEFVLSTKFTLERARQLLFRPDVNAMRYYPILLCSPPEGCPSDHPQLRVQRVHLSLFFMAHVHSVALGHEFILADGLPVLAQLMMDSNMFVRSQAVQSFLQLTLAEEATGDRKGWDWFAKPSGTRATKLHRHMLELGRTPFLVYLLSNRGERTYPSGSFDCLRLFAFWVGWARALYSTPPSRVQLSTAMLALLERWAEDTAQTEEEATLAKQLHEDFSRFGAFDAAPLPPATATAAAAAAAAVGSVGGAGSTVDAAATMSPLTEHVSGLSLGGNSSSSGGATLVELEEEEDGEREGAAFTAAPAFAGHRRGCVFMTGADGLGYYRDPARRRTRAHAAAAATAAAEKQGAPATAVVATAVAAVAAAPPAPPVAAAEDDGDDVVSPPVVLTKAQAALEASHIADLILLRGKPTPKAKGPKPTRSAFVAALKDAAQAQATGRGGKQKKHKKEKKEKKQKKSVNAAAKSMVSNEREKKKKTKKNKAKIMPSGRAAAEPLPDWMA